MLNFFYVIAFPFGQRTSFLNIVKKRVRRP